MALLQVNSDISEYMHSFDAYLDSLKAKDCNFHD